MFYEIMPNVHSGIQMQPLRMNADALGSLAADTAVVLNTGFGSGITQSFLIKQVRYAIQYGVVTQGDNFIIGLCNGSATVAEIASAIRDVVTDVDDASNTQVAALHQVIFWETLRMVGSSGVLTGTTSGNVLNETISIGGGKGIPAKEATGISVFAWNPNTGALTTGSVLSGLITLVGVWLND